MEMHGQTGRRDGRFPSLALMARYGRTQRRRRLSQSTPRATPPCSPEAAKRLSRRTRKSSQSSIFRSLSEAEGDHGAGDGGSGLDRLIHKPVEFGRVVADDLLAGRFGQVPQFALYVFLGVGPNAVGVWEIRAPHDVVFAELVQ